MELQLHMEEQYDNELLVGQQAQPAQKAREAAEARSIPSEGRFVPGEETESCESLDGASWLPSAARLQPRWPAADFLASWHAEDSRRSAQASCALLARRPLICI